MARKKGEEMSFTGRQCTATLWSLLIIILSWLTRIQSQAVVGEVPWSHDSHKGCISQCKFSFENNTRQGWIGQEARGLGLSRLHKERGLIIPFHSALFKRVLYAASGKDYTRKPRGWNGLKTGKEKLRCSGLQNTRVS